MKAKKKKRTLYSTWDQTSTDQLKNEQALFFITVDSPGVLNSPPYHARLKRTAGFGAEENWTQTNKSWPHDHPMTLQHVLLIANSGLG